MTPNSNKFPSCVCYRFEMLKMDFRRLLLLGTSVFASLLLLASGGTLPDSEGNTDNHEHQTSSTSKLLKCVDISDICIFYCGSLAMNSVKRGGVADINHQEGKESGGVEVEVGYNNPKVGLHLENPT